MGKEISHRERVQLCLNHKLPDRIPIDLGGRVSSLSTDVYKALRKKLNLPVDKKRKVYDLHYERLGIAELDEDILDYFNVDTRYVCFVPPRSWDPHFTKDSNGNSCYYDEWGICLRRQKEGIYYEYYSSPLEKTTIEDIDMYSWPIMDDSRNKEWEEKAQDFRLGDCAIFTVLKGVFEQSWPLRGLEQFYFDTALNVDFVLKLMDKVLETQKSIYGRFLDAVGPYLDAVLFTDDICGQNGPLFSPDFYRRYIKSRQKELVDFFKEKTAAKMAMHSDGAVYMYIQDFIDIGIDVLNPVQVTATGMDAKKLKQEFAQKISFWGGIDTQKLLPFGNPREIGEEVIKIVTDLSQNGGYLFAPVHNIQSGTPVENVLSMFKALEKVKTL